MGGLRNVYIVLVGYLGDKELLGRHSSVWKNGIKLGVKVIVW